MDKRLHIFVGHFGSGKTEVSLNFAVKNAKEGRNVSIVDIDTVNPYFRANDARDILEKYGIKVIASEYAGTNVDIPTLPGEILSVFNNDDIFGVFDVGGDEDGAYALGRYKNEFEKIGYSMHFVVNTKRPMTQNAEEIAEYIDEIENASRLKITDIINNTNLAGDTNADVLMSDYSEIEKVSNERKIPILYNSGMRKALEGADNKFEMEIFIKMPWESERNE